jgi:monothiol glutaredoxin
MTEELKTRISNTIGQQKIMLFMKGSPAMPQCGFSAAVVGVLKQIGVPFGSFNILADQELREGLKQFSNWPTYPQLYVDGKLVGGSDIVREMHARGELEPLLRAAAL